MCLKPAVQYILKENDKGKFYLRPTQNKTTQLNTATLTEK